MADDKLGGMKTLPRRMVILTDGYIDAYTAKTAACVLRYRPEEVVAVLDRTVAGKTCGEVMGVGDSIPIVASLEEACQKSPDANALLIGIAPPGGKIPHAWRPIILEAIARKMTIVSGLHELLRDDAEFAKAAREHGTQLIDVRASDHCDVAHHKGIRDDCFRVHTIGNDCSCGKMVVSVELANALQQAGVDAQFVATGQTGILVAGSGIAVDQVMADYISGAAEQLVLDNQDHEVMVIEGQGSLFHPRYSGVTLGLLHGLQPHALILCYEMGRTATFHMEEVPLPPLGKVLSFYEQAARIMRPCQVIGIAINGSRYSDKEVAAECQKIEQTHNLPTCDVLRQGPKKLVQAIIEAKGSA